MAKSKKKNDADENFGHCHYGNVVLLENEAGGKLMIGGRMHGLDIQTDFLVIDMTSTRDYKPRPVIEANDRGRKALSIIEVHEYGWVNIPVVDGSTPRLNQTMWQQLAQRVKSYIDDGGKVMVACMAGHGRSGTAAAILLDMIDPQDGDPVKRLRDAHCERAIESQAQIDYIAKITGKKVTAGPRPYHGLAQSSVAPRGNGKQISWKKNSSGNWDKTERPASRPVSLSPSGKIVFGDVDEHTDDEAQRYLYGVECRICTEYTLNTDDEVCDDCRHYAASIKDREVPF